MDNGAINDIVIILPSTMKKKKGNDEPIVVVEKQLLRTYLEQIKGHLTVHTAKINHYRRMQEALRQQKDPCNR